MERNIIGFFILFAGVADFLVDLYVLPGTPHLVMGKCVLSSLVITTILARFFGPNGYKGFGYIVLALFIGLGLYTFIEGRHAIALAILISLMSSLVATVAS